MNFHLADFIAGINDGLSKIADEGSIFDITGAIFPNVASQAKWKFGRNDQHLHLNDGNNIYSFHLPEGEKEQDFPVSKVPSIGSHEFTCSGTAQIHRADPGSIYFTLQDGSKNPTYTFKHVNGEQWRAIPKVKHCCSSPEIDKEAFLKGASEADPQGFFPSALDVALKGIDGVSRAAVRGTMALGHDPLLSAGAGAAAGGLYDLGRRALYNTDEENDQETGTQRLMRYLLPAAAAGGIGGAAKVTFPDYYNEFPMHRP